MWPKATPRCDESRSILTEGLTAKRLFFYTVRLVASEISSSVFLLEICNEI